MNDDVCLIFTTLMTNVTGVIFVRVWFHEPKNASESGEVSTYCVV